MKTILALSLVTNIGANAAVKAASLAARNTDTAMALLGSGTRIGPAPEPPQVQRSNIMVSVWLLLVIMLANLLMRDAIMAKAAISGVSSRRPQSSTRLSASIFSSVRQ